MENQMEKNMENEMDNGMHSDMETGIMYGILRIKGHGFRTWDYVRDCIILQEGPLCPPLIITSDVPCTWYSTFISESVLKDTSRIPFVAHHELDRG